MKATFVNYSEKRKADLVHRIETYQASRFGEPEVRFMPADVAEVRAEERDGQKIRHIVGYAALFNVRTELPWGWREQIAPGAFKRAIIEDDVRALWNHEASKLLGRNKSRTLELSEDERGLFYDVTPPSTSYAFDLLEVMDRGDLDQSSFAFLPTVVEYKFTEDYDLRTIKEAKLFDVSPVTYAQYEQTSAGLRAGLQELTMFMAELRQSRQRDQAEARRDVTKTRLRARQTALLALEEDL